MPDKQIRRLIAIPSHMDRRYKTIEKYIDYMHINTYIYHMNYTYDQKKRAANLKKHGYDFEDAPHVIESGHTVTFEDHRFDYDEQRFITLGVLREDGVVIATSETEKEIRVISMRKADKNEQKIYYSNL